MDDIQEKMSSFLAQKICRGNLAAIKEQLDLCPDLINAGSPQPLLIATADATKNRFEILQLLLERGADPNLCANNRASPKLSTHYPFLHLRSVEECKLLASYGADHYASDANGRNALHHQFSSLLLSSGSKQLRERMKICEWLIKKGLSMRQRDIQGRTPFLNIDPQVGKLEHLAPLMEWAVKLPMFNINDSDHAGRSAFTIFMGVASSLAQNEMANEKGIGLEVIRLLFENGYRIRKEEFEAMNMAKRVLTLNPEEIALLSSCQPVGSWISAEMAKSALLSQMVFMNARKTLERTVSNLFHYSELSPHCQANIFLAAASMMSHKYDEGNSAALDLQMHLLEMDAETLYSCCDTSAMHFVIAEALIYRGMSTLGKWDVLTSLKGVVPASLIDYIGDRCEKELHELVQGETLADRIAKSAIATMKTETGGETEKKAVASLEALDAYGVRVSLDIAALAPRGILQNFLAAQQMHCAMSAESAKAAAPLVKRTVASI